MTDDQFNEVLLKLWSMIVLASVSDDDAMEMAGRMMMSVALKQAGGDPLGAMKIIRRDARYMVRAIRERRPKIVIVHNGKSTESKKH